MRYNRFSSSYLLTLILIICALVGPQLTFAQGKKPVFQPECETPGAKTAPSRIPPPIVRPTPTREPIVRPTPSRDPIVRPTPPRVTIIKSAPSGGLIVDSTRVSPKAGSKRGTIPSAPLSPVYRPIPEIDLGASVRGTPVISTWPPVTEQRPAATSEVINKVLSYSANTLERTSKNASKPITVQGRRIPIYTLTGAKPHSYYSNAIYIHRSHAAASKGLSRLNQVNKDFIRMLGTKLLGDPNLRAARFMTTAKSGSDELVTIFEVRDGKFGGIELNLNAHLANCGVSGCTVANVFDEIIGPWLEPISGSGRLYMIGDDLEQIDPVKLANRFNCEVLRRPARMQKGLIETESQLTQLTGRQLEPAKTEYVNGLPRNEFEAIFTGYQRNQVKGLLHASKEMDKLAKQFFKRQKLSPAPIQNLQELLVTGESDVVLIVAHSDKERIYINGTQVTIDEIKNYPNRFMPNHRPRIGILLSCYGGDLGIQKGWFLKRNVDSLAEVLVLKGYFDKVVAPKGEITPNQVAKILKDYFSGKLIRGIAAKHLLLEIAEFRKRILPSSN